MIHARKDYDRIQDPAGLIGEDEPVFLIRARDENAPAAVRAWAGIAEDNGADAELLDSADRHAGLMEEWQRANGCKTPDAPAETLRQ